MCWCGSPSSPLPSPPSNRVRITFPRCVQGRLLASGQTGENADVCVWDFASRKLLYRFSEHDFGIVSLSFSDDEVGCSGVIVIQLTLCSPHTCVFCIIQRLLVSVGDVSDKKMFVWDVATYVSFVAGCYVASPLTHSFSLCVCVCVTVA